LLIRFWLQIVDEVTEPKEVKELLLSTVTQADLLTQLINERLAVENVVASHPADDVIVSPGLFACLCVCLFVCARLGFLANAPSASFR
jgi:hypothetical protein